MPFTVLASSIAAGRAAQGSRAPRGWIVALALVLAGHAALWLLWQRMPAAVSPPALAAMELGVYSPPKPVVAPPPVTPPPPPQAEPPPPPKPKQKPVVQRAQPKPVQRAPEPVTIEPAATEPVTAAEPSVPVVAARPAPPAPAAPAALEPPRFDAAYLDNPPPPYPAVARRRGLAGTVLLRAYITADGRPAEVAVQTGSGHAALDSAALEAVRKWRFVPARRGAETVAAWVEIPIVFKLKS